MIKAIFKTEFEPELLTNYSGSSKSQYVNVLSYFRCEDLYYKIFKDDLLFRLSHCYKWDIRYIPDLDNSKDAIYDGYKSYVNNNNCVWGVTSSSTACISFINDYSEPLFKNIENGYLLLYAVLLNQKYTLYRFLEKSPNELNKYDYNSNASLKLREEMYRFEMDCNFQTVSELPQYQKLYEQTYEVFNINSLIEDVCEPLDAYDSILREKANKEEEKRENRRNDLLFILSILSGISVIYGMINSKIGSGKQQFWIIFVSVLIVAFLRFLIFVISKIKGWYKERKYKKLRESK